jgi:amino acid adenylation domain-containing protein
MSKEKRIQEIYGLSPMQSGMLFHSIIDKAGTYFEQTIFSLKGRVDTVLLEESFVRLVARYDILRTIFRFEKMKEPLQFVLKERRFKLHYEDLAGKMDSEKNSYIEEFRLKDLNRGFDLGRDLLMRVALFKTGDNDHRLIWSYHHIIMDGWGRSVIFLDLIRIYSGLRNRREVELPPPIPFQRYIRWIEQQDKEEGLNYWARYLEGYDKQAGLPAAWKMEAEGPEAPYQLKNHTLVIEDSLLTRLNQIASDNKTTLNVLLQTVWGFLLQVYNHSADVVFGAVVSGRPPEIEGIEQMVGLLINTIPVRIKTGHNQDFHQLLAAVRQENLESKPYEYLPLAEVQANSPLKANLMDHLLAYENYPVEEVAKEAGEDEGLGFSIASVETLEKINYDFYISIFPGNRCRVVFSYNSRVYRAEALEATARHFYNLLRQAAENPALPLSTLEILTKTEKEQLLYDFCTNPAAYPEAKTIHQLFTEQAARTPGNIALGFGSKQLSYRELNRRSGSLAGVLRAKGVKAGTIVGILADRSLEMVIALLAVLKTGGGYLPMDTTYPGERIAYILEDSDLHLVLSYKAGEVLGKTGFSQQNLDLGDENSYRERDLHLDHTATPRDLAYIIYTSGSTGKPKGVMIEHRNVVRLLFNDKFQFDFHSRDTWTMFHSYCFDFSVWEMYGALLYGGGLIVISKMTARDPGDFLRILKRESVTVLNQTPSAFYNLIQQELTQPGSQLKLRYVIFGGEALKPGKLAEWREKYPETRLVNMFGITETTVHVTYKEITGKEIAQQVSNIGAAIPTLSTFILDLNHRLLPPGIPGEICVGGPGVARGYLNNPQLTTEKFIQSPYIKGKRLYLSGDLAQLTPAGDMEYLGRIDRQVQVRGFRVELGEIENQLLSHDEIDDVVVMARTDENGEISLCAYMVATRPFTAAQLREYLSGTLPDHMIPGYFQHLERLPLTPNGKVDHSALPAPGVKPGTGLVEPRNELETRLAALWKNLLQLEQVGVRDSFFNVGGDSIKAIRLISLINAELNANLKIENLYQNDTIAELASLLDRGLENGLDNRLTEVTLEIEKFKEHVLATRVLADEIEDLYPMSDIQKGMVFLSALNPGEAIYHDQNIYQVKSRDFDARIFKIAAEQMVAKHSILRTTFNLYDVAEPVQIVRKAAAPEVNHLDISHLTTSQQEAYLEKFLTEDRARPFDVNLPLWRIKTFGLGGEDLLVALICHHSILDGWSVASLTTELHKTYLKLKADPHFVPDPLKSNYKDFVIEQIARKRHESTIGFWKKELGHYRRLDIKGIQETGLSGRGSETCSRALEPALGEQLQVSAAIYRSSVKNMCFGAYMYLMSMLSYENDLVVGLVTNNRPPREDGDKILGCFLNSVPVRLRIPSPIKHRDYMKTIESKLLELKSYDRLPLFEIARLIGEKPEERNPIFDTLFNYTDFHIYGQAEVSPESGSREERLAVESYAKNNTLLDINIDHTSGQMWVILKYDCSVISKKTAEKLSGYYTGILEKWVRNPEGVMSKDGIMEEAEKQRLLYGFNNTRAPIPAGQTIHGLFAEQVETTPDAMALVFENSQLTYGELNRKANRLSRLLREKGVSTRDIVGILCQRSLEMVIALMAVLKTGGTYLPIEPSYPAERIQFMLKDSSVRTLLVSGENSFSTDVAAVIPLDDRTLGWGEEGKIAPGRQSPHHAYIIYTSGTTGRPKGVAIQHTGAVNTLVCRKKAYALGPGHAALQLFSYSFDGFITSFFTPVISGAAVVLPGEDVMTDLLKMKAIILKNRVTHFIVIPPLYRALIEALTPGELASLEVVTLAGDSIAPEIPGIATEKSNKIEIAAEYGVTEASVMSTMYRHMSGGDHRIIGTPTWNTAILILDKANGLLPEGIPGELCISGVGVASGYLNRPELTAERFLENPFLPGKGKRMYKTADLARWLPQGNIEFLGRLDHQVKIRGFRVEPGEIEARLVKCAGIKEALVLAVTRGAELSAPGKNQGEFLCAYIVPKNQSTVPDQGELKQYLAGELPDYMIPLYFLQVEKIPLTPNGKLDRRALPLPETPGSTTGYAAPQSSREKIIADTWKEVLKLDRIGINDNLFELGGNSLDLMKIIYKLNREFRTELPAVTIFKYPTIALLAEYFNRGDGGESVLEEQTILPETRIKGKNRVEALKRKRREM